MHTDTHSISVMMHLHSNCCKSPLFHMFCFTAFVLSLSLLLHNDLPHINPVRISMHNMVYGLIMIKIK